MSKSDCETTPDVVQQAPVIRKPWERSRVTLDLEGQVNKTDTSFGNDTDVNKIVERFKRTGVFPVPPPDQPEAQYADVSGLQTDLTEALEKGRQAREELARVNKQMADLQEAEKQNAADKAAQDAQRLAEYDRQAAQKTD